MTADLRRQREGEAEQGGREPGRGGSQAGEPPGASGGYRRAATSEKGGAQTVRGGGRLRVEEGSQLPGEPFLVPAGQ